MNAIEIINEALDRPRQYGITVDGIQYPIYQGYTYWFLFADKYRDYISGKNTDLTEFDYLYPWMKWGNTLNLDREKGLQELLKFYKEPFYPLDPFAISDTTYKTTYNIEQHEFFDLFKKIYGIDLTQTNIHFHKYTLMSIALLENNVERVAI